MDAPSGPAAGDATGASGRFEGDELDALLAPLGGYSLIVLAVSGGADSIALMHLVARWRQAVRPPGRFVVATVDHGLRTASRSEAEWVGEEARVAGFEHVILAWEGAKPSTGVQEAARAARYRLLAELAHSRRGDDAQAAIVTAHTEDDQAETFLMRLARGSGLDGLSAMQPERRAHADTRACTVLRPLLGVSGERLRGMLRDEGRAWLEDPSNDADCFERVRFRKAAARLAELGLTNESIAVSARRLARARQALERTVDELQQRAQLDLHGGAFASFDAAPWQAATEEIRLRLLGRLIAACGGQEQPAGLASLEALTARMGKPGFEGATLGGAIVELRGDTFRVMREGLREPLPVVGLAPGASVVWDHRFRVTAAQEAPGPVEVGPLGTAAFADLRHFIEAPRGWPARAIATLPALRAAGELLLVPQLASLPGAPQSWADRARLYSAEFLY